MASCRTLTSSAPMPPARGASVPRSSAYQRPSSTLPRDPYQSVCRPTSLDSDLRTKTFDDLTRGHSAQISDDAVVRKDLHLVVGECDRSTTIVLARATAFERASRTRRACRTVMPISDIQRVARRSPRRSRHDPLNRRSRRRDGYHLARRSQTTAHRRSRSTTRSIASEAW